jgi:Flp pilus assembly pilin Flp
MSLLKRPLDTSGQATVEYLIVGLVLIAIILALGLLAQALEDGLFVEHAAKSASHAITTNSAGTVGDVFLY